MEPTEINRIGNIAMSKVDIRRDSAAAGLFVALGVVFGLVAILSLWAERIEGFCFVVMAAASIFAGVLGLLDSKSRITISDKGLTVRALGSDEIAWQNIRSARIESLAGVGNTIILEMNNGTCHRVYADALQISSHALLNEIKAHMLKAGSSLA